MTLCTFRLHDVLMHVSHGGKHAARLAQSVEHETLNLRVVGSSPTLGATFFVFFLFRGPDQTTKINSRVRITALPVVYAEPILFSFPLVFSLLFKLF